jgi:hypothetical protein
MGKINVKSVKTNRSIAIDDIHSDKTLAEYVQIFGETNVLALFKSARIVKIQTCRLILDKAENTPAQAIADGQAKTLSLTACTREAGATGKAKVVNKASEMAKQMGMDKAQTDKLIAIAIKGYEAEVSAKAAKVASKAPVKASK